MSNSGRMLFLRNMGWSLALALVCPLGCAAPLSSPLSSAGAPRTGTALLRLALEPTDRRGLLALSTANAAYVTLTVDGPDLPGPDVQTLPFTTGATVQASEPIGPQRIVTLQYLDAQQAAIPGGLLGAVGAINAGSNTFTLDAASTAASQVAAKVLARDRANQTAVLGQLDLTQLAPTLAGFGRQLALPSLALLDTTAIASDTYGAASLPAFKSAYGDTPGQLIVKVSGLPTGTGFSATLSDPLSKPVMVSQDAEATMGPVASGSWTLTVTPSATGFAAQTATVTVAGGQATKTSVAFGTTTSASPLSAPYAPAGFGTVMYSGAPLLCMVDGSTFSDAAGLAAVNQLEVLAPDGSTASGTALNPVLLDTAATTAGNRLYWFGGADQNTVYDTAARYDPNATSTPQTSLPAIPGNTPLVGASAGAIGTTIYLAGGRTDFNGTVFPSTLAFDTLTNTWASGSLAAMPHVRSHMASAVIGNQWYLFGGTLPAKEYLDSGNVTAEVAQHEATSFTPGGTGTWKTLAPMPTARSGASALVYNGKIYVIGGAGTYGDASAAIEVYDPTTNSWSQHAPLQTPRAFPAVALFGNKIMVAGGLDGADPGGALPVATVEEVTP